MNNAFYMKQILLALQFLTIVPVKDPGEVPVEKMGKATAVFPLVGLFEGAVLLALASMFLKVFPAELTNGLLVLAMVIINGGLHLDGLADTFDAIASRADREKKFAIMKQGTVGALGVIAIVMALLLKYLLLNALFFNLRPSVYYTALLLMPVLCRWTMVVSVFHGRSARQDGLGKIFIDYTRKKELLTATAFALLISFLALGVMSQFSVLTLHLMFVMPVLYMSAFPAVWFSNKNFGGMTGDTIGAAYEITVLLYLIIRVIWS